ncbi:MAG: thiamine-phosphate kinase [Chloroflexota bacterium]
MTVAQIGEFGLIARLARIVSHSTRDPLQPEATGSMSIGDDAALWEPTPGFQEVLTTDALIEDIHFRHHTTSWHDLGWKALAENVSDIAAMGARPTRAFITLGLRPSTRVADLEDLYRGFDAFNCHFTEYGLAHGFAGGLGVQIAGGDTVSSPVTMLSITVVGELTDPGLRRAAGRPGDLVAVTGTLGGSSGGLALLERGDVAADDANASALLRSHCRPMPRVAEGVILTEHGIRCGMDLSDGLLGDIGKLAYASGLRATIRYPMLPVPPELVRTFGEERARELALVGGEDYELLVAGEAEMIAACSLALRERGLAPLTPVGWLEAGPPGQVAVVNADGAPVPTPRSSWDHFQQQGTTP